MIYELLELSRVLAAVQTTGTEVRYYDEKCHTDKVAGYYRLNATMDRLVICPRNHINHSDLFDTIRHEAVHVVQGCKGGGIMPYDYWLTNATRDARESAAQYPKDVTTQHYELEAFSIAEAMSEGDIIKLINTYCFE